ncbi:protein SEY1 [Sporothrix schenckii 1099-18]|uniref:Protein SEY1 n=2 Tax=Sporothrix schenckii TaxID=29908 RepID=U7PZJ5_SPOS1|nr:protein SEY1 [Sporothrix schenckii 1099-18]ERT00165.1 protein SEY1 [Sporothrix schenckii ATCC 58251]KJR85379.1 protein SEY1 [Sporothrix schenckii 1099-18]
MAMNNHFVAVGEEPKPEDFGHGIQVIDEDKAFSTHVNDYLRKTHVAEAGFNYHLISVFGSQSTGKSTLLNHLFGTEFSVMSESERRQTTKGIWMSKNKKGAGSMADNILVMDVEGTDGRERGEDQDFERKSALFALATSEVLIVNIWEHQVGLYQGANMGLLKTVFEVNLQLFLKDRQATPRSLLFFVIRDFIGNTPLSNLRNTLVQDLTKIWSSISKPAGLENATIDDYFDFAFAALPHKILQPDKFVTEVDTLGRRFVAGHRSTTDQEFVGGVFLPEYHRRIPADGFSVYAEGVWDQIVNNKDLDLPTQQELLAQFRCDEIAREALVVFDETILPLEQEQADSVRLGRSVVLAGLGTAGAASRAACLELFQTQAGRYHKGVFTRKLAELGDKVDGRLKTLYQGQLAASHKAGVASFTEAVTSSVKAGQKAGGSYEFAEIVETEKAKALKTFKTEAQGLAIPEVAWTNFKPQYLLFEKELDEVSGKLRKEEMRRLATRLERWVKSRLGDAVGLEFNKLGSGRAGGGAPDVSASSSASISSANAPPSEKDLWDRVWKVFVDIVEEAQDRFTERAKSFDASEAEVQIGLWRLRRKSWVALRERIDEEVMEGNILLKLRENFEDKFRYDDAGVPRIWRPSDDIEGIYTRARESTLTLIPLLARFRLAATIAPPDLPGWIGNQPAGVEPEDEDDLTPIGGVDEEEGKSLEEEMTVLSESKRQDLVIRFKKTADGVYVEAKRGALGGITQVPLYFYGILLMLGWNEILAVLRNPFLFLLLAIFAGGTYVAYSLSLLGPMMQMANAASNQAVEIGKQKLRDFINNNDSARQALAMPARSDSTSSSSDNIHMDTLNSSGRRQNTTTRIDDDDI